MQSLLVVINYFINFWVWWYAVKAYDILQSLIGIWAFNLNYLNLPAMLSNFFVPLYQDQSLAGRFLSIVIRVCWIIVGSVIMVIVTIPLLIMFIVYLFIPILPIVAGIYTVLNIS